jgi:hypothetical protein
MKPSFRYFRHLLFISPLPLEGNHVYLFANLARILNYQMQSVLTPTEDRTRHGNNFVQVAYISGPQARYTDDSMEEVALVCLFIRSVLQMPVLCTCGQCSTVHWNEYSHLFIRSVLQMPVLCTCGQCSTVH